MLVAFQSENGIIGFGARPPEGMEDPNLTDAGGGFISALPGRLRLRQRDVLRADPRRAPRHDGARRACRWMRAGGWRTGWCRASMVAGMGGAMDLVAGAQARGRRHAACRAGRGEDRAGADPAARPPRARSSLVVTDLAVIEPTPEGLVLRERAPGVSVEEILAATTAPPDPARHHPGDAPVTDHRPRRWSAAPGTRSRSARAPASTRVCTPNDLIVFAHASGNLNPLHLPGEAEQETGARAGRAGDVVRRRCSRRCSATCCRGRARSTASQDAALPRPRRRPATR